MFDRLFALVHAPPSLFTCVWASPHDPPSLPVNDSIVRPQNQSLLPPLRLLPHAQEPKLVPLHQPPVVNLPWPRPRGIVRQKAQQFEQPIRVDHVRRWRRRLLGLDLHERSEC